MQSRGQGGERGASYYCEIYLQELKLILTVNIKDKSSHAFSRGKGKRTIFKIHQSTPF